MSKSDLVEAVDAALVQWNKGWQLIEDALVLAESEKAVSLSFRQLDHITAELRKQLRRFEHAVEGLQADTWHPWRTDYPQREDPIPFSTGEDLCIRCQDIIVSGIPIHQATIGAWAVEVRKWFKDLRKQVQTPDDADKFVIASELWRGRFDSYKAFKVWLSNHPMVRNYQDGQRRKVHPQDFLKEWQKEQRDSFESLDGTKPPPITPDGANVPADRYIENAAVFYSDVFQRKSGQK